ncbi:MAG: adenosine deaminase [Candidatus Hodarchaeales archaeon]|jgi:adenosine deaminase
MRKDLSIESFIKKLPKAELHLHIEGTFEPELMFKIAKRNNIKLRYKSIEKLREAYSFRNLQDFLDIYYEGAGVLITEQDFYDLTWNYFEKVHDQSILHSEIFFDPQTHTHRGILFSTVINGIHNALIDAREKLGISNRLIMCFLRDLDERSAMETLERSLPYKGWITAVGLDSAELGNPPSKFKDVFERARKEGYLTVAHAGEEGPASYVWEAINILKVVRIDHSNHALDDNKLVSDLVKRQIPLTVCPLSNVKLAVVKSLENHPLKIMMDKGLFVTLSRKDIYTLARNSFQASFLEETEKNILLKKLEQYIKK